MKKLKLILTILVVILLAGASGIYVFLSSSLPQYNGEVTLKGLNGDVEVLYDEYGVPHIYAKSEEDAYFALGYVHAQDRLFQMEMMRRLAAGKLAEVLGSDLLPIDKYFRTIGLNKAAEKIVADMEVDKGEPYYNACKAYLSGVNQFIELGTTPPEFTLLGIPKQPFDLKDTGLIAGYMSFSFGYGVRIDPYLEQIAQQYGDAYLKDLSIDYTPNTQKIPVHPSTTDVLAGMGKTMAMVDKLSPVPLLIGSNSWIISAEKSTTGFPIFANDTHMGHTQPAVWYEAHLEAPGLSVYGKHLAGAPMVVVGHNRFAVWGMTMFENDDMDFFAEKVNPNNPDEVLYEGGYEAIQLRKEEIYVKGQEEPVTIEVKETRHGPIMNDALMYDVGVADSYPMSLYWTYLHAPGKLIKAVYSLAHTEHIDDARKAASMIHAPGLNIMYADRDGNIAWWAAAKILHRNDSVHSKRILDGSIKADDYLGFHKFSQNPQSENPPSGYIYSANNQPDSVDGVLYPGYYAPENRADRIVSLLEENEKWSPEMVQEMVSDVKSAQLKTLANEMVAVLESEAVATDPFSAKVLEVLKNWDGGHKTPQVGPVVFYKMLARTLSNAMMDEMGEEMYGNLHHTHLMYRTLNTLMFKENSVWWDDLSTDGVTETRTAIFVKSFNQSVIDLQQELGSDISAWQWGNVHTLEHQHPLGKVKPLDKLLNVGPMKVRGGWEVIDNSYFKLPLDGQYHKTGGPAMRVVIDLSDIENGNSILPTGQAGHFMSKHYDDQAEMYNVGMFKTQWMNRKDIETHQEGRLLLKPVN
ncbi:penicillin acylase family protein [Limibacter armeniacum]|uniref:penicillin acylase family protein n=1 Tax=Limibacter armeniacum TaxID=466084 RepID=UPI002FE54578